MHIALIKFDHDLILQGAKKNRFQRLCLTLSVLLICALYGFAGLVYEYLDLELSLLALAVPVTLTSLVAWCVLRVE